MSAERLERLAVRLANLGDGPCLDALVRAYSGGSPGKWALMLASVQKGRYRLPAGMLAPVVFPSGDCGYALPRQPVCLMPVQAGPFARTSGDAVPLYFGGSRDILAHSLFAAGQRRCEELTLFGNVPSVGDDPGNGLLASLPSAGLAAFLAAFGWLRKLPSAGWVACTGVLAGTAHAGILPPVGPVEYIWDKYKAMTEAAVPEIGLILLPSDNRTALLDKLGQTPLDRRVRFIDTLQQAAEAVWGAEATGKLGELATRDQVRHLEADWFHAPYDEAHQNAVLGDAERLLQRHQDGQNLTAIERVICLTIKGHFHSHRGEESEATRYLGQALEVARQDAQTVHPTLDLARCVRLENAFAVSRLGALDPLAALAILDGATSSVEHPPRLGLEGACETALPVRSLPMEPSGVLPRGPSTADPTTLHWRSAGSCIGPRTSQQLSWAGEQGLFHQGTRGQALSLLGAQHLAAGQTQRALDELAESEAIHRFLLHTLGDDPRHRCYGARALALMGQLPQALELLLPDPSSPRRTEFALSVAPDPAWAFTLAHQPDPFTLLRLAHLFWATHHSSRWLALCQRLHMDAPASVKAPAHLETPQNTNAPAPEEPRESAGTPAFAWPLFGLLLQHAVNLAEAGGPDLAQALLAQQRPHVLGQNLDLPKRELPSLYWHSANVLVASLAPAPPRDAVPTSLAYLQQHCPHAPMSRVLENLRQALSQAGPASPGSPAVADAARRVWLGTVF